MKFFADPTIRTFTSGRPSQNFDIVGLSFPRRFELHFNGSYAKKHGLYQQKYVWTVYEDRNFTKSLGKEFSYSNVITGKGWFMYKSKAIFPNDTVYLKLTIISQHTQLEMKDFFFKFTKAYQESLDGRVYIKDPVTHKRIVHDGTLEEMQRIKVVDPKTKQKSLKYIVKNSMMPRVFKKLTFEHLGDTYSKPIAVIDQIYVHYTEKPRVVFFITPPHLASYARIVLILMNQMFNMQVAQAYMTNANQKPDYPTFYMMDEVGNLQSDGSGIPFLQTKESIGLAQGQFYTLILQTLQQLNNVQFCASVMGVYLNKSLIRWKNLKSQLHDNVTGNSKRERGESGKKQLDELRAEINSDSCPAIHA